jgi:hypothetical protein
VGGREREKERKRGRQIVCVCIVYVYVCERERACVCVCVCVCVCLDTSQPSQDPTSAADSSVPLSTHSLLHALLVSVFLHLHPHPFPCQLLPASLHQLPHVLLCQRLDFVAAVAMAESPTQRGLVRSWEEARSANPFHTFAVSSNKCQVRLS